MDRAVQRYGGKTPKNIRIFLAETMGTFILLMFGIGSVAQFKLGEEKFGNFLSVNLGWGIGCCLGVYWSAGVSGGHINPAVSLAMVFSGRLNFRKLFIYWAGQSVGAFMASALCFLLYKDLLNARSPDREMDTAGIFSTYLHPNVSRATGFGDQVIGTMILVSTVFALTDKQNNPPSKEFFPVIVGLLVVAIGTSFGINCGYGINPARDLIPRLFTWIAGWGSETFTTGGNWSWITVIGQFCGGTLGAALYLFSVEMHHPATQQPILTKIVGENTGEDEETI